MHVIRAQNVNDAYFAGVQYLLHHGERQDSRAGTVLVSPTPVTTVYARPRERVLMDSGRDANPFFHLFESLWMLAGRDDATWLDRFVKDFSSRFSEPGGAQWGAYGHRWRRHFGTDQLEVVIQRLKRDPLDRRVVVGMWDPESDLIEPNDDGTWPTEPRDLPCNTHIYPRIRNGVLDITVCCRSNDAVWGAYGANAVHFSVLQEYLAARLGVEIGTYYQVSNNFHVYESVLEKIGKPTETDFSYHGSLPMVTDPEWFDEDLRQFMGWVENQRDYTLFQNRWFDLTAAPAFIAHGLWKNGSREEARATVQEIRAPDWRMAMDAWMLRRMTK